MNDTAHADAPPVAIEKARRFYTAILNRMSVPGTGIAVAAKTGLSESTISRAKEGLEHGCAVIAAIGLKVVKEEMVCVDPGEIGSLRRLRRRVEERQPLLLDEDNE